MERTRRKEREKEIVRKTRPTNLVLWKPFSASNESHSQDTECTRPGEVQGTSTKHRRQTSKEKKADAIAKKVALFLRLEPKEKKRN